VLNTLSFLTFIFGVVMKGLQKRFVVLVFLVILLVPLYGWIVQIVNGLGPESLVKSFVLKCGEKSDLSNVFHIRETLTVVAESKLADTYELTIYENFSVVLVERGEFNETRVVIEIGLDPPLFNGGNVYVAVLDVYVFNVPILGVSFSDSVSSVFEVASIATRLEFDVKYDSAINGLYLNANLTDAADNPVANEPVDFLLQFVDRRRPTEGWVPLGSSKTDANGEARLNLAFGLSNGNYSIKTFYKGNQNFGESENVTNIEIFSNMSFIESMVLDSGQYGSMSTFESFNVGNLTLEVSSHNPYALLPMNASAKYTVDIRLQGFVWILFYLDFMNGTGFLAATSLYQDVGPLYVYETSLVWSPTVTGSHKIIAGVVNGTMTDFARAMRYGEGLIASNEVGIDIQRCPSNVVLDFPEALYGDTFPVTVAVAKPRPYQFQATEFYNATTLAPKLSYNGADYAIDEPTADILIKLYANDTLVFWTWSTDVYGLVRFQISGNFTSLRLKAAVDESSLLSLKTVERSVSRGMVRVYDVPTAGNKKFQLNYTINKPTSVQEFYVGVEYPLMATSNLFNQSVWNLPVSVTSAKFVSQIQSQVGHSVNIPVDSNHLRVFSPYNNTLRGDVNYDGKVDMKDTGIVVKAYGSYPDHSGWNPDADVNRDYKVDMKDVGVVTKYFGSTVVYLVFDTGQSVLVDSQGCVRIPSGAKSFMVKRDPTSNPPVAVIIEFFRIVLDKTLLTNNVGQIVEMWRPMEAGRYIVQTKTSLAFNLFLAFQSNFVHAESLANIVNYFDVGKRPIELSVSYEPSQPTLDDRVTMIANVVDLGLGEPAEGLELEFYLYNWSSGDYIYLGSSIANSSGIATLLWTPRTYYETGLYPDFVLDVVCKETAYTQMAEVVPVHVDTRYPTRLEFLGSEVMNVAVGAKYYLTFRLVRADNDNPVDGRFIYLYINDASPSYLQTNSSGMVTLQWTPLQKGTYSLRASFSTMGDWIYKPSNEVRFVMVAEVVPMSILFDVQPREFKPETRITLTARVLNTTSSEHLQGRTVTFYMIESDGSNGSIGESITNASGFASLTFWYPSVGVHAFAAKVVAGQHIITSPVMLTVAKETALTLNIEKNETGFNHVIFGQLLSYGEPVGNKLVKIFVNDTLKADITTWELDGSFDLTLNLPPANNKPTVYRILATFEGDSPSNATAYAYTLNGTRYAVCTTIQYGLKPAGSSVTLTVEPQSTQVTTTKTPEQMQQEAQQNGWLTIWHEFSWWYPWYRIHFVYVYEGVDQYDQGISPLPFVGATLACSDAFLNIIRNLWSLVIWPVAASVATAEFLALIASNCGPIGFSAALLISIGTKGLSLIANWNSIKGLASAFIGGVFSTAMGMLKWTWDLIVDFLKLLMGIIDLAQFGFGNLYRIFSLPANIAFLGTIMTRLHQLGAIA